MAHELIPSSASLGVVSGLPLHGRIDGLRHSWELGPAACSFLLGWSGPLERPLRLLLGGVPWGQGWVSPGGRAVDG